MKKTVLALLLGSLLFGDIKMDDKTIDSSKILIKEAKSADAELFGPFLGTLSYDDKSSQSLSLYTEAVISKIHKRAGDEVKKGDLLFEIFSRQILADKAALDEASRALEIASQNLKKDEELFRDGVIPQRELQDSRLKRAALAARVGELSSSFMAAGIDPKRGGAAEIRATKSGILVKAPKKAGDRVEPFIPFAKISKKDEFVLNISIPVKLVGRIKKGDVLVDKNKNRMGTIISLSSSLEKGEASIYGTAKLNKGADAVEGMQIEFFVDAKKEGKMVLLPRSSVTKYKNRSICFVRTKNGFRPTEVFVISESKDGTYIKEGSVKPGSKVASGNLVALRGALVGMGFE